MKEYLPHVVVLGAGYGGLLTALRLSKQVRGQRLRVTLIDGRDTFTERIRLHQVATKQTLPRRALTDFLDGTGVVFQQGWVTEIDAEAQIVCLQTGRDADVLAITYDYLVYALGSVPDTSQIPGAGTYSWTLDSHQSAAQLSSRLSEGGSVLIVGAGLTGIETATEVASAYPSLAVTLATRGRLGNALTPKARAYLRDRLAQLNISVWEQTPISRVESERAWCENGDYLPFSTCIWTGSQRAAPVAEKSGLAVDKQGRVLVNAYLQVAQYPNIYAIGDAAATTLRASCAVAMPMGAYVADLLKYRVSAREACDVQPFQFGFMMRCISLGRQAGLIQFVTADDQARNHFIPGWLAAKIKELVCRYTIWSLWLEKWRPGSYHWPSGKQVATVSMPTSVGLKRG